MLSWPLIKRSMGDGPSPGQMTSDVPRHFRMMFSLATFTLLQRIILDRSLPVAQCGEVAKGMLRRTNGQSKMMESDSCI